jgi:hypothetical protein
MFGNKENDGFLDGLFRAIGNFVLIFAILAIIWHLIYSFFTAVRTKPLTVLIWVCVFVCCLYYAKHTEEQDKKSKIPHPQSTEDTRSGREIWKENMKDYDAERGY